MNYDNIVITSDDYKRAMKVWKVLPKLPKRINTFEVKAVTGLTTKQVKFAILDLINLGFRVSVEEDSYAKNIMEE